MADDLRFSGKMVCKRVRKINGVFEHYFAMPTNFSNAKSVQEYGLFNLDEMHGIAIEDEEYLIDIRPAKGR